MSQAAEATPLYHSLDAAAKQVGISPASLVRLSEIDPTFPRLYRIAHRKVLIKLPELQAWIEKPDRQPINIRGEYAKKVAQ